MQLLGSHIRIAASDFDEIIDFINSDWFLPSILTFLKIAGVLMFIVIVFFTVLFSLAFASSEKNKPTQISDLENKQEINHTQYLDNISDLETKKAITQTAKAIAEAYLEETSETPQKYGRKSRLLGKTARSLAKKYLDDNKQ